MADSLHQIVLHAPWPLIAVCVAAFVAGLFHKPITGFFRQPNVQEVLVNIDWLKLIEEIAPLAAASVPGGAVYVPYIVTGINVAQAAHDKSVAAGGPGLTGQDKLNLAVAEVITGVNAAAQAAPSHIDPTQVASAISSTVDTAKRLAAIVNTAKNATAPVPPTTATPPTV